MSDRDSNRQRGRSCKHLKWLSLKTVLNRRSTKPWRKSPSPASNLRNRHFSHTAQLQGKVVFIGVFGGVGYGWHRERPGSGGGRGTGIEPSPRSPEQPGGFRRAGWSSGRAPYLQEVQGAGPITPCFPSAVAAIKPPGPGGLRTTPRPLCARCATGQPSCAPPGPSQIYCPVDFRPSHPTDFT